MTNPPQVIAATIRLADFCPIPNHSKRPFGKLPKRRYTLIVCEGTKTEPAYFQSIIQLLPREMVEKIEVKPGGGTPDYLLKQAQAYIACRNQQRLPSFYFVWLVFDRDDFKHFTETINQVAELNKHREANQLSFPKHWDCAWSNEAFELWYILHFQEQLGGSLSRKDYQDILEKAIQTYTGDRDYRYQKNDPDMFKRLYPLTSAAIERAERGFQKQCQLHGSDWALMNPATRVFKLVRDLLAYLPSHK